MSILKRTKYEILIFFLITISIYISYDIDVVVKNFFERLIYSPVVSKSSLYGNIYLKKFFLGITKLGDSLWYFSATIIGLFLLFLNKKINIINLSNSSRLTDFFISSFIYLISIGVFTQIIKHLIGRPRPKYTDFGQDIDFHFFYFDSRFHSFPSGHSSTIFMVFLILSVILPKLKYVLFIFASIVALSRVAINAHYFTDVVGGMFLSFLIFKFLNISLEKKYKNYSLSNIEITKNFPTINVLVFLIICCVFVTYGTFLDIYVAGLFYQGNPQFLLQKADLLSVLFRDYLLPVILFYVLILPIIGKVFNINIIYLNYRFSFKEIFLIWSSQIITTLIVVNLFLKKFWGRVRPEDILQLGGIDVFTPWYKISSACSTNCSFVSGDASVGFSVVILYFITKKIAFLYAALFLGFIIGLVRIMAGAHFISDIFFAGLFVVIINLIIFILYKKYNE